MCAFLSGPVVSRRRLSASAMGVLLASLPLLAAGQTALPFSKLGAARALALQSIGLTRSAADFPNPERGFYNTVENLATAGADDFAYAVSEGSSLVYAPIRLDSYRVSDIPQSALAQLQAGFDAARSRGVKLIVRVVYNNPANETEYRTAQDASLSRVQAHLNQLQPLFAGNADIVAFWQAGFIGAWGEWHTSSNRLDTPTNKLAVRDALLSALPRNRFVQVRYPPDVMSWFSQPAGEGDNTPAARIGIHNDCFLASATDVGTYAEDASLQQQQRNYVKQLSKTTPFGGETCKPADEAAAQVRMSCSDILREGADYHLSYLNREYHTAFPDNWRSQGCYGEVAQRMGYRFELVSASYGSPTRAGADWALDFSIKNVGWARLYNARPLEITLRHRGSGQVLKLAAAGVDPRQWLPDSSKSVHAVVKLPQTAPRGDYDILLGMPDAAPSLANDSRYAVRFANADDARRKQGWEAALGRFRLGGVLTVQ